MGEKAKLLLSVAMLSVAGMSVANTFVNVFLIRATDGNITMMLLQNIVHFVTLLVAFVSGSKLLTKISITWIFRFGVIAMSLYYIGILIAQDDVGSFLIPLGIINGLGGGFFALSLNLLVSKTVSENEQGRYFSYQQMAGFIFGVVTPVLSGFIITRFADLTGYYFLFAISIIFFILSAVMIRGIKGFTVERKMQIFKVLQLRENKYWEASKYFSFFMGFRLSIEGQITMVFAFLILANEQIIGNISSVSALIAVISSLWFAKTLTAEKEKSFYFVTAILMLIMNITLALFPNRYILMIVWIGFAAIRNWGDTIYRTMLFKLTDRAKGGFEQSEYLVAVEFPLCFGRVVGLTTALAITFVIQMGLIAYQILFVMVGISWIIEYSVVQIKIKWLRNETLKEVVSP